MRILYVSGGSVGHLAPLVAVERAVRSIDPSAKSFFLCSDRTEDAQYLQKENVEFAQVPRLRRSLLLPFAYSKNRNIARHVIETFKPDAVFCKGGAVSIPTCKEAAKRGIPIILHESDAVMGKANQMMAKWAKVVCFGIPKSGQSTVNSEQKNASQEKTGNCLLATDHYFTGNPIRPEVTQGKKEEGLRITSLSGKKPVLLVIGGSQGAQVLNAYVQSHIEEMLTACDVIHLTGKGKKGAGKRAGYWSAEFAHEELPHLYACSNFALCRAGAGTISELAANGIPMILVPIKGLANDHQVANAQAAAATNGSVLLFQEALPKDLLPIIHLWATSGDMVHEMSQKIRTFQHPDAALRIAQILAQSVEKHRGDQ